MKILESQNALLSNYEVYQHIVDQQKRNKANKRRVPGNLATLMTEVRRIDMLGAAERRKLTNPS